MIKNRWDPVVAFIHRKMMKTPDFIVIGAQRSGTTWLYQMLSQHAGVFLPAQKELHFFDEKPDFSNYEGIWKPVRPCYYNMNSAADWRWYLGQFQESQNKQIKGEITPFYATLSEARVRFIARALPGIKIIYILRNPVQRAWSNFRFSWKNHTRTRECELTEEIIYKTIFYPAKLTHGDYQRNIEVWERNFPRKSMLYLFYDDIVRNPCTVLDQVCEFLEIAPLRMDNVRVKEKVNQSPEMRMPENIHGMLSDYFSGQIAFIQKRFDRILRY